MLDFEVAEKIQSQEKTRTLLFFSQTERTLKESQASSKIRRALAKIKI